MHDVLGFEVEKSGVDSALPYAALFLTTVASGRAVDMLRTRKLASTTTLRKTGTALSLGLAATFLLMLGYMNVSSGSGKRLAVGLVTLATASLGIGVASWNINHVDLSCKCVSHPHAL
jgi:hypothetical protein